MKRSEMQTEIELFIDKCINRDGLTVKETAECLLDFIEGCGMLPPGSYIRTVYYGDDDSIEELVAVWEDEDEA